MSDRSEKVWMGAAIGALALITVLAFAKPKPKSITLEPGKLYRIHAFIRPALNEANVTSLRATLQASGMQNVQVTAPDSSNATGVFYDVVPVTPTTLTPGRSELQLLGETFTVQSVTPQGGALFQNPENVL